MTPAETVRRANAQAKRDSLELAMWTQIRAANLVPRCHPQFQFTRDRKWKFDFAWPHEDRSGGVALEVEGGTYAGGRHTRGAGYAADIEKYNEAALGGWIVLRADAKQVKSGAALAWLERALK